MLAIYKRELKSYFTSMIGYVFLAFVIAIAAVYFVYLNLRAGIASFSYVLSSMGFVFLVAVPILTMRSMAEDKKNKTDQLLYTSPVSVTSVVMGKFLAVVSVFLLVCILFAACPLILMYYGANVLAADYSSLLAFFLMGCAYLSLGMFISSLTESQIIACVATFGSLLLLYFMSSIVSFLPTTAFGSYLGMVVILVLVGVLIYTFTKNWVTGLGIAAAGVIAVSVFYMTNQTAFTGLLADIFMSLSLADRFTNFANQIFDVPAVVYYISFTIVFLFLTVQSVQKRRWS